MHGRIPRRRALAALGSAGAVAVTGCLDTGGSGGGGNDDDEDDDQDGDGGDGFGGTPTSAGTPAESPTRTPPTSPTATATPPYGEYADSFERESFGERFYTIANDGTAEITGDLAVDGDRSLRLSTTGARSIVRVRSNATMAGELAVTAAVNRTQDNDGVTGATLAIADPVDRGTTWPSLQVSISDYAGSSGVPVVSEFNEESRVLMNEAVGPALPKGEWARVTMALGERSVTVTAGGNTRTFSTDADWTSRPFHVDFKARDSGEADGITAAFDDLVVGPR